VAEPPASGQCDVMSLYSTGREVRIRGIKTHKDVPSHVTHMIMEVGEVRRFCHRMSRGRRVVSLGVDCTRRRFLRAMARQCWA